MSAEMQFYRDRFTEPQRRRVEALIVGHRLFPYDVKAAVWVAGWIITGRVQP